MTSPPVPATDPPVTSPPTPQATTTAPDQDAVCQASATDCQTCLGASCAWFPSVQACELDCTGLADTECFAASDSPDVSPTEICQVIATAAQDRELCAAQDATDCATCLATMQSDGSPCQWYVDPDNGGLSWCGTGTCNMEGICGSQTCDDSAATQEPVQEEDTSSSNPCSQFNGYGADGCPPCLSSSDKCAWSIDTCLPNCDIIADDAPCFHADSRPNTTIGELCDLASVNTQDAKLCARKNYCFTCTSTLQTDEKTPCAWYKDEAGNEWCGTGGCDSNGVCGETDETVCQVPTETPVTRAPTVAEIIIDDTSASTSGAKRRQSLFSWRQYNVGLAVTVLLLTMVGVVY
ncbi:expressed unknown protein [Seminavis robusta]|uniref:Uncharacterized protein n=1 Tax=Seminavis robusta TaxID=568900 RepID=A0A9N8D9Z0_9STRA|nr:expressed unknown protein [Seminavis robusta]|eukprot:Sro28_g018830.1 n/a (350) ;mRNA; f:134497-135546